MYNDKFVRVIKIIVIIVLFSILARFVLKSFDRLMCDINENITTENKVGKIIDSSKESINGLIGGHIQYETAIKVDGEIIISDSKDIYYEAKDKIGKEVKVKIENDKNINTKSILDID